MASLADLYSFQAMIYMYLNAATQLYAVPRMGGDGIRVAVVKFGHNNVINRCGPSMQGV
jgi:hypothetical protein